MSRYSERAHAWEMLRQSRVQALDTSRRLRRKDALEPLTREDAADVLDAQRRLTYAVDDWIAHERKPAVPVWLWYAIPTAAFALGVGFGLLWAMVVVYAAVL